MTGRPPICLWVSVSSAPSLSIDWPPSRAAPTAPSSLLFSFSRLLTTVTITFTLTFRPKLETTALHSSQQPGSLSPALALWEGICPARLHRAPCRLVSQPTLASRTQPSQPRHTTTGGPGLDHLLPKSHAMHLGTCLFPPCWWFVSSAFCVNGCFSQFYIFLGYLFRNWWVMSVEKWNVSKSQGSLAKSACLVHSSRSDRTPQVGWLITDRRLFRSSEGQEVQDQDVVHLGWGEEAPLPGS